MSEQTNETGHPSVDKPWLKYYTEDAIYAPLSECTIYEYIYENNRDYPNDIAMHYFGRDISFRTLFQEIDRAASAFASLGVKAGDVVTMITVTTPETVYALYALNRLGAISNMVDPRTSEEGIREYIQEVNGTVVLTINVALPKVEQAIQETNVKTVIVTSPFDSMPPVKRAILGKLTALKGDKSRGGSKPLRWNDFIRNGERSRFKVIPYQKDRCCVIVHTGGTTGVPKGVMLSDDALNKAIIQCELSGFVSERANKLLDIMPPFIAYGILIGLHFPLSRGVKVILIPQLNPDKLDRLILKFKPNYMAGVPSHYEGLIHSGLLRNVSLDYLHFPVCGGDAMLVDYEQKVNAFMSAHNCPSHIIKGYGMTEFCATACVSVKSSCNKQGSVGIPLTHTVISVFSPETGEELSYNEPGEVCMQGPHIMLGYYKNDVETKNVLRRHADGSIWLHSGDLGYMDEDGCLYIHGRIKSMIIRGDGFKVFPNQIEQTVSFCADVTSCGVVGVDDPAFSQGQRPVVFAVKSTSYQGTDAELIERIKQHCAEDLPEYAQPMAYKIIDSLPLTGVGKVDYRALEQRWVMEMTECN